MDVDENGNVDLSRGGHGYDAAFVEEMDAIMYAYGPDIKAGQVIEEMDMVDHYGLFCHLLGLSPRPNNGSTEMYDEVLSKFADSSEEEKDGADDDDDDDDEGKEGEKKEAEKKTGGGGHGDGDDDDDDDDDDNGTLMAASSSTPFITVLLALTIAYLFPLL